jgi:beta-mannosidase
LIFSLETRSLLAGNQPGRCFMAMNVFRKDHLLCHNIFFFEKPGKLILEDPQIELKSEKVFDKIFLFIKSKRFAKSIFIDHAENDGFFSDNFFDLFPGEEKIIIFQSGQKNPDPDGFKMLSLYDVLKSNGKL